jgi:hypothetical protein
MLAQRLRIMRLSDGVQVGNEEERLVRVLQRYRVTNGAKDSSRGGYFRSAERP